MLLNIWSAVSPFQSFIDDEAGRIIYRLMDEPERTKKKMLEITNDLQGVHDRADDILLVAYHQSVEEAQVDHDRNLENVKKRLDHGNVRLNKEKPTCANLKSSSTDTH
ncbi:hypothetical protein J6590_059607 [Homalodisca vitripennis]|nr:hypothetical protein J6590_059607 [Homalodisca vitripennis]